MDAVGNAEICNFGMAAKSTKGRCWGRSVASCSTWPQISWQENCVTAVQLTWSLGIVLCVIEHFPYLETSPSGIHQLITNTMYYLPCHLSQTNQIIIERLYWYMIVGHLMEHLTCLTPRAALRRCPAWVQQTWKAM